jgi:hypothetical protein
MKAIKYIAVTAAALAIAGCSKWTEQEPVEVLYPTLKDKNPALYAQYMESIREYHATEHPVLIAKFDNKPTAPAGRADHLICLPDSVDFVILNNPDGLSEAIIAEMKEIKEEKAVPTLMEIRYDAIVKEWEDILAEETEPSEVDEQDRFIAFAGEKVRASLAVADKYAYDGINVVLDGKNPASLWEEQQALAKARYDAFLKPVTDWAGDAKVLFFEGNPKYLLTDTDILARAKYIILPCETLQTGRAFDYTVAGVMDRNVPADKFVIGVTALDVTDETAVNGTFTDGASAIVGAARWTVSPAEGFAKKGVCVNHAQFDYYSIRRVYGQIGAAISIMNPSPVK